MSTPLRTEKQRDANWLSLNADTITYFAGTPQEVSYSNGEVEIPRDIMPPRPKDWETAFKCSKRTNTHLTGLRVAQCKENVHDANNQTAHCSFYGDWGVTGDEGEQVFTGKGGSHHLVYGGAVHSRGARADIVIGLWSDQCFDASHNLDYSRLVHASGRPLTFILCRVNNPIRAALGRPTDIKLPPGAKVLFWKSIGAQIGWWVKWLAVKAGLFR